MTCFLVNMTSSMLVYFELFLLPVIIVIQVDIMCVKSMNLKESQRIEIIIIKSSATQPFVS